MYVREWIHKAIPERTADRYVPQTQTTRLDNEVAASQLIGYTQTRELLMVCGTQANIDELVDDMENSEFYHSVQVSPQEYVTGIEKFTATITGLRYLTETANGSYNPAYRE